MASRFRCCFRIASNTERWRRRFLDPSKLLNCGPLPLSTIGTYSGKGTLTSVPSSSIFLLFGPTSRSQRS